MTNPDHSYNAENFPADEDFATDLLVDHFSDRTNEFVHKYGYVVLFDLLVAYDRSDEVKSEVKEFLERLSSPMFKNLKGALEYSKTLHH